MAGGVDGGAHVEADDRSGRTGREIAIQREDARGTAEPLHQAAGDDADDAWMPAFAGDDDQRRAAVARRLFGYPRQRVLQNRALDPLAVAIELIEFARQRRGLGGVVGRQQAGAETGFPHPSAGIDPGTEHEPRVVDVRRLVLAGEVGQRPNAGVGPHGHHLQSLHHEGAVDAGQRHQVADGSERHEIQPLAQIGLRPGVVPPPLTQRAVDGGGEQKRDAHGGEMAIGGRLVDAVRIDHRRRHRKPAVGRVMVHHDHVEPRDPGGVEGVVGIDPAIHGDHHRRALGPQPHKRLGVGTISLGQSVGNIDARTRSDGGEEPAQQRPRRWRHPRHSPRTRRCFRRR